MAYVETSNLDGETNLKIRQGDKTTAHMTSIEHLRYLCGRIECDTPNRHLYEFNGVLYGVNTKALSLGLWLNRAWKKCRSGPERVLLRGASLRNTRWACGVVVYTGHESKLMLNSRAVPLKCSNVDITTNYYILILFAILLAVSTMSALFSHLWLRDNARVMWYIPFGESLGQ